MAKRKQLVEALAPVTSSPLKQSKIPSPLRFPTLVLSTMILYSTLYTAVSPFSTGELAGISRNLDGWQYIGGILGLRTAELAVGWWGEYDGWDIQYLTFLTHMPTYYLLTSFYAVRPTTLWTCITIDVLSTWIPFALLRDSAPFHKPDVPKREVANRSILKDLPIRVYTSVLGAAVYGAVVSASYRSWLPVHLVIHFYGLKSIKAVHVADFPQLFLACSVIGYAAAGFLFTPALGAKPDEYDIEIAKFNPETATLSETIWYNVWGYSKRSRTLIKRTTTLALASAVHTGMRIYIGIEGADLAGAIGWGSIWAVASTLTGAVFWWVGDVDAVSN